MISSFRSSEKLSLAADEEVSVGAYEYMMQSLGLPLICLAMMRSDLLFMAMTSDAILLLYRWATPWHFTDDVICASIQSPYRL